MKRLLLVLGYTLSLGCLHAEPSLLAVDFNTTAKATNLNQEGFEPFDVSTGDMVGPLSINYSVSDTTAYPSGIGVTMACGKSENDQGRLTARIWKIEQDSFPYKDLYSDAICGASGKQLIMALSGLKPLQRYKLCFYVLNSTRPGSLKLTDISSGEKGESTEAVWTNDYQLSESTAEDIFSTSLTADANAEGKVIISILATGNEKGAFLNGFRIFESKP